MKGNNAEVWVYVHAFPSEISKKVIEGWLKDHTKESGINVKGFEIVEVANLLNRPAHEFCIFLEYSKKQLRKLIEQNTKRLNQKLSAKSNEGMALKCLK